MIKNETVVYTFSVDSKLVLTWHLSYESFKFQMNTFNKYSLTLVVLMNIIFSLHPLTYDQYICHNYPMSTEYLKFISFPHFAIHFLSRNLLFLLIFFVTVRFYCKKYFVSSFPWRKEEVRFFFLFYSAVWQLLEIFSNTLPYVILPAVARNVEEKEKCVAAIILVRTTYLNILSFWKKFFFTSFSSYCPYHLLCKTLGNSFYQKALSLFTIPPEYIKMSFVRNSKSCYD